jgi:YD repeat-containing protein
VTNPLGNETTHGYHGTGQITLVADPLGGDTTYTHDDAGRRMSVSDATVSHSRCYPNSQFPRGRRQDRLSVT